MDVYETVKTIGSGSFGQVYMARHKREGKHYVVKRVKTRDMSQKDLENTENEVSSLEAMAARWEFYLGLNKTLVRSYKTLCGSLA